MRPDPIQSFLDHQTVMVMDGGLATALEHRGFNLDDDLWSAKVLIETPDAIRQVHLDFLSAGADCITTSTYQASIPGFLSRGYTREQAVALLRQSVRLGTEARNEFWANPVNRTARQKPLVAASIGPYGACLADGSEYTGDYTVGEKELEAFHEQRLKVLSDTDADVLACETIPSHMEATVLLKLLRATPGPAAWMTFSCRDIEHISDGTAITDVAQECDAEDRIAAIGVNCTAPEFIASLIKELRSVTRKPIVVYPNSGERFDAASKTWKVGNADTDIPAASTEWVRLGANCIGGCCRVGPTEITRIRRAVVS